MGKPGNLRTQQEMLERLRLYKEGKKSKAIVQKVGKNAQDSRKIPVKDIQCTRPGTAKAVTGKVLVAKRLGVKSSQREANINKCCDVVKCQTVTQRQDDTKAQVEKATEVTKLSYSKVHAINKKTKENLMPNRKRRSSFTLAAHEVSPFLKRPVINDNTTDGSIQSKMTKLSPSSINMVPEKRHSSRRSGLNQLRETVEKPTGPEYNKDESKSCQTEKTGSTHQPQAARATNKYLPYLNPKLSVKERLEMWKKEKEQQRLRAQQRKSETEKKSDSSRTKHVATDGHISACQSTSAVNQPKHSHDHLKQSRVSRTSTVQRTASFSGADKAKHFLLASNLERRKSYACQIRSQFAPKPKPVDKMCSKQTTQTNHPPKQHSRSGQQSESIPDDNPLKRRLSYAMSLRERIENKPTSAQKARKRRITASNVSLMNAKVPKQIRGKAENRSLKMSEELPITAQTKKFQSLTEDVNLDNGSQATASFNISLSNVQKSCRKSLSVRFATDSSSPDLRKRSPTGKTPLTPVQPGKIDATPVMTPSRLSPIRKEPSLREKLDIWLKSHGKTPSRFSHLLMFGKDMSISTPNPQVNGGLDFDELLEQQEQLAHEERGLDVSRSHEDDKLMQKVEVILSECIVLLDSGCPTETIQEWLKQICDNLDGVKQVARYWVCLAKIAQRSGNSNAVIRVFEESVKYNPQPPEELAHGLKDFVENMDKRTEADSSLAEVLPQTPQSQIRESIERNVFMSSAVKFLYTTTPFTKINIKCRHAYSTPRAVVTPVRRSTRRSVVNLPSMLKDHDRIVESLSHLSIDEKKQTLFMPNTALEDTLNTTGTAL